MGSGFIINEQRQWEQVSEKVRKKILAYSDNLMLVKVEFLAGGIGTIHKHPHVQISHVESGVFEIEIDGKKRILKAGDAFHIKPNQIHGAVCLQDGVLVDAFSPMREDFIEKTEQNLKNENF